MEKKKISIIIPIYNTEQYLETCLQSVINQEYKNLEIILLNDGSTDNSLFICNDYKNKDDRIIVINKKHTGVADTRNIGIKKATGDYIGFVDSDDYIDKDMFKRLVKEMEKYNCDISMCDLEETYSRDDEAKVNRVNCIQMDKIQALEQLLYDKNIGNYVVVKLFKKELFDDIEFPVGRLYEDISTVYKLFYKSDKILYIPIPMYHYYQRTDSIVNNRTRNSIQSYLEAVFERYYDIKNNYDRCLDLYNVYSLVNVVIKMGFWTMKIRDYDFFNTTIREYYYKMKKELNLVDEKKMIEIMTDIEKTVFSFWKM